MVNALSEGCESMADKHKYAQDHLRVEQFFLPLLPFLIPMRVLRNSFHCSKAHKINFVTLQIVPFNFDQISFPYGIKNSSQGARALKLLVTFLMKFMQETMDVYGFVAYG